MEVGLREYILAAVVGLTPSGCDLSQERHSYIRCFLGKSLTRCWSIGNQIGKIGKVIKKKHDFGLILYENKGVFT
jgi:hypothetical protein